MKTQRPNYAAHRVTPRRLPSVHLSTIVTTARQKTELQPPESFTACSGIISSGASERQSGSDAALMNKPIPEGQMRGWQLVFVKERCDG